jgi:hypothetical protein
LGTLEWVSGVCIDNPVPASSALNNSYALTIRMDEEGDVPVCHHFISSAGETGYYFIHDEGLCANWDSFPWSVGDVSETGTNRMP